MIPTEQLKHKTNPLKRKTIFNMHISTLLLCDGHSSVYVEFTTTSRAFTPRSTDINWGAIKRHEPAINAGSWMNWLNSGFAGLRLLGCSYLSKALNPRAQVQDFVNG